MGRNLACFTRFKMEKPMVQGFRTLQLNLFVWI